MKITFAVLAVTAAFSMAVSESFAISLTVRANCSTVPVYITPDDVLSVYARVAGGESVGMHAEFWVAARSPHGWYYYNRHGSSWIHAGSSYKDIRVTYQGSIPGLAVIEVLKRAGLPLGTYTFYLGVDTNMNGAPDLRQMDYSSVLVNVVPEIPDEFSWSEDPGIRLSDGSVPGIHRLGDGRFRLYYGGQGGICSAISTDGLNFQTEEGVRVASGTGLEMIVSDPSIVSLSGERVRMYYKGADGPGGPGQAIHKVFSAISEDGLNFTKEGVRIDSEVTGDNGWASVPDAVLLPDGRVRIYYVSADREAGGGMMSAVSDDGLNFQKEPGARLQKFVDPAVCILPNGKYLMLAAFISMEVQEVPRGIYSFTSEDGLTFENQQVVLQADGVYDPTIAVLDNGGYRVYYGKDISENPDQPNVVVKSLTGQSGSYTRQSP